MISSSSSKGILLVLGGCAMFLTIVLFTQTNHITHSISSSRSQIYYTTTSTPMSTTSSRNTESLLPIYIPRELGRVCSAEEIASNAARAPQTSSECPTSSQSILNSLLANNPLTQTTSPEETNRVPVIVSIGCNKADDFISAMRQWSNNRTYSIQELYAQHEAQTTDIAHYACGRNAEFQIPQDRQERTVYGICVEPMESTQKMLSQSFRALRYHRPHVALIHAAVSTRPGTALFPVATTGTEHLGLHHADASSVNVTITTLRDIVQQENIPKIDYLSIDTEGHDVQAILGGVHIFAQHRVRYVELEHHGQGRWVTSSLQDLADLMDQFGYDCYWTLNNGKLVRLTGCWSDAYLQKTWSNLACISRLETVTHQFMEELAVP